MPSSKKGKRRARGGKKGGRKQGAVPKEDSDTNNGNATSGQNEHGVRVGLSTTIALVNTFSSRVANIGSIGCVHGCPRPMPPICHSVSSSILRFCNDNFSDANTGGNVTRDVANVIKAVLVADPQLWHMDSLREEVTSFLAATGTDLLLGMPTGQLNMTLPYALVYLLLVLENRDQLGEVNDLWRAWMCPSYTLVMQTNEPRNYELI